MKTSPFKIPAIFWRIWIVAILSLAVASFFAWRELPLREFRMWFLDVGQGDGVLIQTAANHQILVDGGDGEKIIEELSKVMPFFDRSLDMIVLTHPHEDHVGGLVEVLKKYSVESVLLSGVNNRSGTYDEFLNEIIEQDVEFFIAEQLVDFRFGEVVFDVLYPFEPLLLEDFNNLNNSSLVLMVHNGDERILLTGDIEEEIEELLLAKRVDLKADVLKLGHHGSKTSSGLKFLAKVRPKKAVIQVGAGNSYGHPSEKVLRNLHAVGVEEVFRTDLDGRIEHPP
ncbi:MBL fold metallo-hydrolase [Candidatus Gracilibacteria bacterium]|nr:MBL fold metallo-hydrolase [Candidatus Gracilibacteria bacterium]